MQEAVDFYATVFPDFQLHSINPMTAEFTILGQDFIALNGGSQFTFNESVSFFISCKDQVEIDYYWNALTQGGSEGDRKSVV